MNSAASTRHRRRIAGNCERRPVQDVSHDAVPSRLECREISADSCCGHLTLDLIDREHLAGESPQIVQRFLCPAMALRGSVAEAKDPLTRMPYVVPHFLESLRRNSGDFGMRAFLELLEHMIAVHVEQELPHYRERVVAFRKLDDLEVPVFHRLAEVRKIVLAPTLSLGLTGKLEKEGRLADEIERDVRERDVFLENGTVAAPFGHAVSENEAVIGQSQQVLEQHR